MNPRHPVHAVAQLTGGAEKQFPPGAAGEGAQNSLMPKCFLTKEHENEYGK